MTVLKGNVVGIVTGDIDAPLIEDERSLQQCFRNQGVAAEIVKWCDRSVCWEHYCVLLVRSCWDYFDKLDAFVAWLTELHRHRVRVLNPPRLIRWNLSKRYLLDLAASGVPCVPTLCVADTDEAADVARRQGWTRYVVKPETSAWGVGVRLFGPTLPVGEGRESGGRIGPFLVQPFCNSVRTMGERSLVFIERGFSHAARKTPKPDDFRVHLEYGGRLDHHRVLAAERFVAEAAIAALPEPPTYARVDVLWWRDKPLVSEVELIEPWLYGNVFPPVLERLVSATVRRTPELMKSGASLG